jgi:hypothetical protein
MRSLKMQRVEELRVAVGLEHALDQPMPLRLVGQTSNPSVWRMLGNPPWKSWTS